jgi:hypothetical protein
MKLDFRAGGKLDKAHIRALNQIAAEIRKPFSDLIEEISKPNQTSLDWWSEKPASRNTLTSNLFLFCCYLVLVRKLVENNDAISEIVVDSKSLKKVLVKFFQGQKRACKILFVNGNKNWLKRQFEPFLRIATTIVSCSWQYFNCKMHRFTYSFPDDALVLIDTFVYPEFIEKDRLYTGLWEQLSVKKRQSVYFVPNFHGFGLTGIGQAIKQIRKSDRNFLLKEDFLSITDYVYAFLHFLRIFRLEKKAIFKGIDISSVIKEEIYSLSGYRPAVVSILNFRFAKRLHRAKLNLKRVINRFENQVIDKGWNLGFRTFYPNIEIIGYQGAIMPPLYLCLYPTKFEFDAGVIPYKTAVIGHGYADSRREFYPELDVIVAPAFRCQWLWEERKHFPNQAWFTILIALPIVLDDAMVILNTVYESIQKLHIDSKTRFWVKPHPTVSETSIKQAFKYPWPESFGFVGGEFNACLEQSDVLIGNLSFTCLEAIARGVPAIIAANPYALTQNPIPDTIKSDIWKLCESTEDLKRAIEFFKHRDESKIKDHIEDGEKIRNQYFEPVTKNSVKELLGF